MTDLEPRTTDLPTAERAAALVAEAIDRIAAQGYTGRFEVTGGRVWCSACRSHVATRDVRWRVLEVVPTPDQVTVVGGIRCPICGVRGTAASALDLASN